jgi:hypothetical protein
VNQQCRLWAWLCGGYCSSKTFDDASEQGRIGLRSNQLWLINCFSLWSGLAPGRRCDRLPYHTVYSSVVSVSASAWAFVGRWRWGLRRRSVAAEISPSALASSSKKENQEAFRGHASLGPGPAGVIGAITATGSFHKGNWASTALRIKVNHCSGKLVYCSSCQPKTPGDADPTGAEGERRGGCRCV